MKLPRLSWKESPLWKSIVAIVGGSEVAYTPKDYKSLAEAGYQNCSAAFACVKLIASTASRIEWYMAKMDARGNMKEFDRHPLIDLLRRPNELQGGSVFTEQMISHLLLAGNSYVFKVSGSAGAVPRFLYTMRPDRVEILPDKTGKFLVRGYRYKAGTEPKDFPVEDVMHLMEFHPTEDFYGLSRIEVAARHIDIANLAAEWNAKLLTNDMRAPGVVTAKSLGSVDIERFKSQFAENYAAQPGKPFVFAGEDVKWETIALNPKDVDWLEGQKFTLRQICTIFGVASELLGDSENKTYSNIQEARKALYMEAILPMMDMIRDEYQRWLVPLYGEGLILDYDRDSIDELQEDRAQQYGYLAQADWLTVNEKRVATGFDEIEGGDVILVPISNVPLEEATAPPQPIPDFTPAGDDDEPDPDADPDADDVTKANKSVKPARRVIKAVKKSFWTDPERKEKLWTTFEQRVRTRERSFQQAAKDYQQGQAERVRQAALKQSGAAVAASSLLDVVEETKLYFKKFYAWYHDAFVRAGNAGMRAAKGELFNDGEFKADVPASWVFRMTPEQEQKLHDLVYLSGTKVNETTIDIIFDQIKLAQAENLPVAKFAQDLGDKLVELSSSRSMLWARTESAKVDNYGQLEGYKETEHVDMKGWLSAFTPDSRDDHMNASGDEVKIDDDFNIGGEFLAYPGDPRGSAANVCNCLCSTYPVVGPD